MHWLSAGAIASRSIMFPMSSTYLRVIKNRNVPSEFCSVMVVGAVFGFRIFVVLMLLNPVLSVGCPYSVLW